MPASFFVSSGTLKVLFSDTYGSLDPRFVSNYTTQTSIYEYTPTVNCNTVTDVSYGECVALVDLYTELDGDNWEDNGSLCVLDPGLPGCENWTDEVN
jgi:hypothetical protein